MKISRLFLFLFIFTFLLGCKSEVAKTKGSSTSEDAKKTIMAIFAHPDDETTIGPILAEYANLGDIHVVVATDGRYGVADHGGLPAGDALVAIRKDEMTCACKALGINPPHFLNAKDGLGLNGNHDFYVEVAKLKERIKAKIAELNPDVILTFGPDGDTGHPDHRMVGMMTTEILLRENWVDTIDLYHFAWTEEQTKKFPEDWGLGWVHPDLLHTRITFSHEAEERAFKSLRCHKSQYQEAEFDSWIQAERNDTTNILYFRKFALDSEVRKTF
jgi:LmbE family N-acetylglucosaminyl deacetylase